ncbi:MAG: hypothetical protein FWG72_02345 [Oscillospiraceae bacterium]|nr:hypothetical protein [Oscillospiraceae bacterium]
MSIKKWFALFLAAVLLIALSSACALGGGGGGGGGDPGGADPSGDPGGSPGGSGGPVDLVIYSQLANFSGVQAGWAAQILKEKFNVTVSIIPEADGAFATRMEAGFLGDIILFGGSGRQYRDAVNAGMLFDWEEDGLVQTHGPYIWEHMQFALGKNRDLNDGKLYGFGHNVAGSADDHQDFFYYPYLRWDLYQQLGYPRIQTLEDYIPVIEAMVALEPQNQFGNRVYGVSFFPQWDGDMVMMVKSTGALYGYDEFGFGLYDTRTQTYQPIFEDGSMYLRALSFYNQLFQRGLVDPDSMTQTFDDMREKYLNGQAMFNIFSWMADPFNTEENMAAGKAMMCVAAEDQENIVYGLNPFGGNRVWAIGAQTAYPELCMEIINWLCTPEGVLSYNYGPQGVTWDYDENGDTYMTEAGLSAQEDGDNTMIQYLGYSGSYRDGEFQHNNTTWVREAINPDSASGESFNWEVWQSTLENRFIHPIEQSWRDHFDALRADDYLISRGHRSIAIGSTFEMESRSSELDVTWQQVSLTIKNGSWDAIYAATDEEFDAIVTKMIDDAIAFGYAECVEWVAGQALLRKQAEDEAMGR